VQITSDAAPLLLPGDHQLLAGTLQVGRQPDGVYGGADLADQVVEHPPVGGGELLPPAPGGQGKPPDLLAPVGQLKV